MTILTRGSSDTTRDGAALKKVDYDDAESLRAALAGQDAVVSALATAAVAGPQQQKLADAAYAAGVRRFVPSEFGLNSRRLEGLSLGRILAAKTRLGDDLQRKADASVDGGFSWTGLSTGLFFDLVGLLFSSFFSSSLSFPSPPPAFSLTCDWYRDEV